MNRAFTNREKALMVVLAVVLFACVYYLFVFTPSQEVINNAKSQAAQLETEVTLQQTMAAQKSSMEAELADKMASGAKPKKTARYDSSDAFMKELDGILAGAQTYTLNFADPEKSEDGSTVRHSANINFTASSYTAAKDLIAKLVDSKYSSLVTDFSISAGDAGSGSVAGSGAASGAVNIVYYETE